MPDPVGSDLIFLFFPIELKYQVEMDGHRMLIRTAPGWSALTIDDRGTGHLFWRGLGEGLGVRFGVGFALEVPVTLKETARLHLGVIPSF